MAGGPGSHDFYQFVMNLHGVVNRSMNGNEEASAVA
jgi:hypothetical protein